MANRNSQTIAKEFINNNNYGSIITIIMVIGIMVQIIRVLESCNTSKSDSLYGIMKKNTSNAGWSFFTKLRIKKILRQNVPQKVYQEYGKQLTEDLLNYSKTINESDFNCLITEANTND